jgi:hypothetical protein
MPGPTEDEIRARAYVYGVQHTNQREMRMPSGTRPSVSYCKKLATRARYHPA